MRSDRRGDLGIIRRWALREKMSIREIARRTGLARNTVKKYLAAGVEAPLCQTGEPEQARSVCREALNVAPDGGHEIAKTAAQSSVDPHTKLYERTSVVITTNLNVDE